MALGPYSILLFGGYLWYQNQEKDEIIGGEVDLVEEVSPEGDDIEIDEVIY